MRHQKTKKHGHRYRKTQKKLRIYGGTKSTLSASAKPFVPPSLINTTKSTLRANAPSFTPPQTNINKLSANLADLSIIPENENAVAIDCEMVGVGYRSVLAHVAIVDFNGNGIYNKYVIPRGGLKSITDYRTKFSGITPSTLRGLNSSTHGFDIVRDEVLTILDGKIIVGHGLENDFKVLEYLPNPELVWDTTKIEKYMQNSKTQMGKKQPRKLKVIAKEFANNNIQSELKTGHSPLEDARASMNLYRVEMGYPKVQYENMSRAF